MVEDTCLQGEKRCSRRFVLSAPFIVFVLFGALLFAARLFTRSHLLELDEAEQVLLSRTLSPGYAAQPPLYSWLQYGFFSLFGLNLASISLLKSILTAACTGAWFHLCGFFCADRRLQWSATLSWALLFSISFDVLKDNTHTVLALLLSVLTLLWFVAENPSRSWYLKGGILIGLGILTKFNYLLFVLALGLAGWSLPEYRARLKTPRFALTLVIALLAASPWGVWLLQHPDIGLHSSHKFYRESAGRLRGLLTLGGGILSFLLAPAVVYALFRPQTLSAKTVRMHLLQRYHVLIVILLILMVTFANIANIETRWLIPLGFATPLLVFGQAAFDARAVKTFNAICLATLAAILLLLSARSHWFPNRHARFPLQSLLTTLHCPEAPAKTLVTDSHWLIGNALVHCPRLKTQMLNAGITQMIPAGDLILAWQEPETPEWVRTLTPSPATVAYARGKLVGGWVEVTLTTPAPAEASL
ncbi:glycosyl transferase [Legionella geestiana]|uniref:Glycosyl transferase n=1 Tax=Legionella geestiana TaxID=45065 RepID=A0A0W0TYS9_9GAMM|nr:glycosyltransferase family 39 protein [Legionella geestiana]KTD00673.1 glycosyl transferase [Legionella geestiana]QBS11714.1 hypothetical protein E4T54_02575 [Legionella geestiana]QDQ40674.1 glycosyltransferase family 39 protein [Legionella geestiana]STX53598.1 glycosyl transferase [Legionella geestiana]